ncbi:ADP compounds hydrolase nudE [Serratia fonticola]|uniref:ADP compounds hydrolase nudE n=1 Tax=Serratia fonticola TaxID=47917 RepID=A0A4U9WPZ2_SERFO|nr:ADP compounds hydrolase nudE [Serratia fonticola]
MRKAWRGDEPEPLPQVRWPIANMMALLAEPDFREARNVSALFLGRGIPARFTLTLHRFICTGAADKPARAHNMRRPPV